MSKWDELSLREKSEMMSIAVRNGIYRLDDIRNKYNEFAEGGDKDEEEDINPYSVGALVNAIYQAKPKEEFLGEPSHHYDFTQSEEWANAHGYYPDARGHRDDRVKKPAHPSHPSRGTWDGDKFILTDLGMQTPNYTMFGLTDGNQDPQATLIYNNGVVLPEVTVTPRGNYFYNPYDNIRLNIKAEGGSTSDDDLIDFIIKEEGFNSKPEDIGDGKTTLGSGLTASKWHELYKKRGNKWSAADNRKAVSEEVASRRRWAERNVPNWDTLPESSQKALLSYKYNYDFNRSNSPKLFAALEAGNLQEVARQMDATSKDPKFRKGLLGRRKREQEWFLSDVWNVPKVDETFMAPAVSTAVYNPYRQQAEATQMMPFTVPSDYVQTREVFPSEQRAEKIKERFDAINNFNRVMNLFGLENTAIPKFDGFLGTLGILAGNQRATGGNLYWPGGWISDAWDWIKNAAQVGAIAENPAVMTAAGHRVNRGKAIQDRQNDLGVKQLRENLSSLGEGATMAVTAPADIEAVYQVVRHPVQTAKAVKQGAKALYKGVKGRAQKMVTTSPSLHDFSSSQSPDDLLSFLSKRAKLQETQEASELGKQDLLEEIGREAYKEKWKKAYPKLTDEMVDEIVKRQQNIVEDMPMNFSRSSEELREHPDYDIWGITEPRPEITKDLPNGRVLHNTNTGQDVSIANDRGAAARGTAYHEGQHYMTGMAKGRHWFAERMNVNPEIKGVFDPITFEDANVVFNPRGELWQHAIMDQNNNLLPPVDRLYNMAVNSPNKLKDELTAIGKTPEEAERIVGEWADEAQDMLDIQEQRAHLKTFFKDKVKPLLENEDDASEIESVLVKFPELVENTPKVKLLMEKLRPGSMKDYAKYFAEALSTVPVVNSMYDEE